MKNLFLIAFALVTFGVNAQERKKDSNKERTHKMQDFSPEESAEIQTKKMTLDLDLTKSQQKEIQKINLENAINRKAKMDARKTQKESGDAKKPSKEERLQKMNERLDKQIQAKAKIKKILDANQFEKWEKTQNHKKHKYSKKRKGQKSHKNMQKED